MKSTISQNSINKKVVVVGGGTGSFVVLSGLKNYPLDISAIITSMDSGGSTGRLRDQLGVLPPGDFRQALVALSDSQKIWRDLFTYRFENGDLVGHNFGNIFISALEKITGSFVEALDLAGKILDVKGNVIPVTLDHTELCAQLENGTILNGEKLIDSLEPPISNIREVFLQPKALINDKAKNVLKNADFIVFGPGDLFTSIIPNLLVSGFTESISGSNSGFKAKKIYISNLMTKAGHTDSMGVVEHVKLLEHYLGSKIDYVLVNTAPIDPEMLEWYAKTTNSYPVVDNVQNDSYFKVFRDDFLSDVKFEQKISDRVLRSVLRHDPEKIGKLLFEIVNN